MKKTILTSVLSSIFFLFLANVAVAQTETSPMDGLIVDFLPVKNQTKLPADAANKLHAQIKKHVSSWNRLTVVADIPDVTKAPDMMPAKSKSKLATAAIDGKPAPTKVPTTNPTPTTTQKPNTIALVKITSFKAGSGPGIADASVIGKQKAGVRAQIAGEITFRVNGDDKILDKIQFKGDYVMANNDAGASQKANVLSGASAKSGIAGPSKALKQRVLRGACKNAFKDFKNNAKYAFTSDFELIRVLEAKSGDLLTAEMHGGNMQDVKKGYHYDLYVLKSIGPKQTEESMIGKIAVIQTGGMKSVAKIMHGSDMVHKFLHGETKKAVYARLVENTETVTAAPSE